MADTTHLQLPLLAAAQAQKHVTHNEALLRLDALVQLAVIDRDLTAPPAEPADGDRYIVASGGTGAWETWDLNLAWFADGVWTKLTPRPGWLAWVEGEEVLLAFDGSAWIEIEARTDELQNVTLFGLGTTADATNPFSAKLNKALWTARTAAEGGDGDLVYTMNKEAAADTVSLLFQTGFSGRAEIGLVGDNALSFKVSADGSAWLDALYVRTDGIMGIGTTDPATLAGVRLHTRGSTSAGHVAQRIENAQANGWSTLWLGGGNDGLLRGGASASVWADSLTFLTSGSTKLIFGVGAVNRFQIGSSGNTTPGANNAYSLGDSSLRWSEVFAVNGTINTSDERLKADVEPSELGLAFINALRPVSWRWVEGDRRIYAVEAGTDEQGNPIHDEVVEDRPGRRRHYGLIAQDVRRALTELGVEDFAGWTIDDVDDPASLQGLRYAEFIAPLIRAVQQQDEILQLQAAKIARLEQRLRQWKGKLTEEWPVSAISGWNKACL